MKKVYQVGAHAPVRTYKEALRQHAKLRVGSYIKIWRQPIGCSIKYGVDDWGFKPLIKHGKRLGWGALRGRSNFYINKGLQNESSAC